MRTQTLGLALAWLALLSACPSDDSNADTDAQTSASGTDAFGSSSGATCDDPETQVLFANEGTLVAPMELGLAETLGFDVARSLTAEMGTLTLEFSTTCEGPVYLWALLWDLTGGNETENADSLYYAIDGGEEQTWLYGCSTTDGTDMTWWWLPAEAWTMSACDHQALEIDLPAGDHTIVIRNREAGAAVDVAAIAAVGVSHDPEVDPNTLVQLPE